MINLISKQIICYRLILIRSLALSLFLLFSSVTLFIYNFIRSNNLTRLEDVNERRTGAYIKLVDCVWQLLFLLSSSFSLLTSRTFKFVVLLAKRSLSSQIAFARFTFRFSVMFRLTFAFIIE